MARIKRNLTGAGAGGAVQTAAPDFRAGSELREARERLGWELGEVAAALRIKLAYLQAIEDGRVSALPGNAYALGFLRTYATTLGLDPDDVARRFRAEAHDVNRPTRLAFPAPVPERSIPTMAIVLLGLVIAVVAYVGWYRLSDHEQTATHTVPPVPEQLLAAPKAAPVSPQVASVMPPPGSAPPPLPAPAAPTSQPPAVRAVTVPTHPATDSTGAMPTASSPSPATPSSSSPATAPTSSSAATVPAPSPAAAPTLSPAQTASPPPPAASPLPENGLVLHATAVTWVQIRSPSGHVIWDHVMQPGDTWPVPADQLGLLLTTGNAGGLGVSDNGTALGDFGRGGAVRHNIPLTQAGVRAAISPDPSVASIPTSAAVVSHPVHHPSRPPVAPDQSADQLNAQQLDRGRPRH